MKTSYLERGIMSSKLNIDTKNIEELFSDKKAKFLIPDYQRPYAWGDDECQTLWDDIVDFAFPENDYSNFNADNDEYFLGPIVTFKNENNQLEVIDGQQRLTTLMLLLRAFYDRFKNMGDTQSEDTRDRIERCLWKTDEFNKPDTSQLKIDSEVAMDNDKEEFLNILKTGKIDSDYKSRYAKTYKFFENQINDFIMKVPPYIAYLPARILGNCILLPIEAESMGTALRIFSTLNDRGKPLADADIFKAELYKFYSGQGKKDEFVDRWKNLESKCGLYFSPFNGTPLDDLFTRYMYYHRAKQKITKTTTEALRKFYEKDNYKLLNRNETLDELELLLTFWEKVEIQDDSLSEDVLRRLFVLNYAPNGMWEYLLSVYFMANKDENGNLNHDRLLEFLNRITAFIYGYAFLRPGVNALRTPVYPEMISIVEGNQAKFDKYKFDEEELRNAMNSYYFSNGRPLTKSMVVWWGFSYADQPLIKFDTKLEIEHIYSRKRQEFEKGLSSDDVLESIGNKAFLEKRINIRASDYKIEDKKKYYDGFTTDKGKVKEPTQNIELKQIADKGNFTEEDINKRKLDIIDRFVGYCRANDLIK